MRSCQYFPALFFYKRVSLQVPVVKNKERKLIMPTIGVRAAKELGIPLKQLVNTLNTRTNFGKTMLMNKNGSLTQLGKDVYEAEKASTGTKSLHLYIDALRAKADMLIEPFKTLLKK